MRLHIAAVLALLASGLPPAAGPAAAQDIVGRHCHVFPMIPENRAGLTLEQRGREIDRAFEEAVRRCQAGDVMVGLVDTGFAAEAIARYCDLGRAVVGPFAQEPRFSGFVCEYGGEVRLRR